ncbi:MAG: hypothetical protein AAGC55_20340 [Myxococcota bacterium]
MAEVPYSQLATQLRDRDAVLARWSEAFSQAALRFPGTGTSREIAVLIAALIEGLAQALPAQRDDGTTIPGGLTPGTPWVRELEQAAAFAGASLAASGVSGFDLAAAILALRDVVADSLSEGEKGDVHRAFEWLHIVASDAWGTARERAQAEKLRDQLERDTPVLMVAPTIAAVTLIGAPDGVGLDAIFARLVLLVVRIGAEATIVDATGLEEPGGVPVLDALRRFLAHRKVAGKVTVIAVGLSEEAERLWTGLAAECGTAMERELQFYEALQLAYQRTGYRLIRP